MFLNFNGEVRREDEMLLRADNRGFRYGDGLFETMLFREGRIRLGGYHLDRLAWGMCLLHLELARPFTVARLEAEVAELCARNGLGDGGEGGEGGRASGGGAEWAWDGWGACRVRLTVFRNGGGLYNHLDRQAGYCLQVSEVERAGWREEGWIVDVFEGGRKVRDAYAGIKSNNYLLSTLAGMEAKGRGWNDILLLNEAGRVAESAAANVWVVRGGDLWTPPLAEGCVAGVMRRLLLEKLARAGFVAQEAPVSLEDVLGAEEVFLTNAVNGIRWVREFRGVTYKCVEAREVYGKVIDKI